MNRSYRLAILGSRGFPSTYGGYETLVRRLGPYLVSNGHEVTVYCRTRDQGRPEWTAEHVHCVAPPGIDSKSLSTLSFGLTSSIDAITRREFDAALVLNIANGFFLPVLRRAGVPAAVNTDGIEWERGKWSRVGRSVFRAGAKLTALHADALIADSQAIADIWHHKFGVSSEFIPYGADVREERRQDRLSPLYLQPEGYVLVVARLIPENNVELTIDALESVATPERPLVVVGSANFASPLEQRLVTLQQGGTVKWLGHVADQELLTQLWAHAAVYVHGHSVGGTNPALLQALGAGAPTLALDTVFNREVFAGEEEHLYRHDAAELKSSVHALLNDAPARTRMRDRGRQIIRDRYSWERVCADYERVLVTLAERGT